MSEALTTLETAEVVNASRALVVASTAFVQRGAKVRPDVALIGIMETGLVTHIVGTGIDNIRSHRLASVVEEPYVLIFTVDGQPIYAPLKRKLNARQIELVQAEMMKGLNDYCDPSALPPGGRLGTPKRLAG